jgi:hypothetical protein
MPKHVRTPNCTHLDMDRVYRRDQQCDVCGHSPLLGFLYECRQDCDTPSLHDLLSKNNDDPTEVVKSDMRLQLQWLGLSESVIITAEQGHYTVAQLEKIKTQKKDLRQIISDSLQGSHINNAAAKLAALVQTPSKHDGASNSTMSRDVVSELEKFSSSHVLCLDISWLYLCSTDTYQSPPACKLKACHTCRPYYRERVYISFQSVLNAEFPPVTRNDVDMLPTKSAQVMKTIGNRAHSIHSLSTSDTTPLSLPILTSLAASTDAPPTASTSTSASSDLTFKTTQTDLDMISAQHRPRRRFYKMSERNLGDIARESSRQSTILTRQSLRTTFQGIFRPSRNSSSSRPNITLPSPRTDTMRDSNSSRDVDKFDLLALRKGRREKGGNKFNNGNYVKDYEDVHAHTSAAKPLEQTTRTSALYAPDNELATQEDSTSDSNTSMYTCLPEGSEVKVDGGVALTEEAVETHTPDILAIGPPGKANVAMVQGEEVGEDDDSAVDIGLQSIMAQI